MKHECGGEIGFISITRKDTNQVDVLLICNGCGYSEESTHYLYDDVSKNDTISQLEECVDEHIKMLGGR